MENDLAIPTASSVGVSRKTSLVLYVTTVVVMPYNFCVMTLWPVLELSSSFLQEAAQP